MGDITKMVFLAASVLVLILVLSAGFMVARQGNNGNKTLSKELTSTYNTVTDTSLERFAGQVVTGQNIKKMINDYYPEYSFSFDKTVGGAVTADLIDVNTGYFKFNLDNTNINLLNDNTSEFYLDASTKFNVTIITNGAGRCIGVELIESK